MHHRVEAADMVEQQECNRAQRWTLCLELFKQWNEVVYRRLTLTRRPGGKQNQAKCIAGSLPRKCPGVHGIGEELRRRICEGILQHTFDGEIR